MKKYFQKKIAYFILKNYFGGIPPLPVQTEIIQGPLTQKPFYDYFYNEVKGVIPEKYKHVLDKAIKPDPFMRTRPFITPAFELRNWEDENISIEQYLQNYKDEIRKDDEKPYYLLGNTMNGAVRDIMSGNIPDDYSDSKNLSVKQFIKLTKQKNYHGHMLKWAGETVRSSPECLVASIVNGNYGWPICTMSKEIQDDPDMVRLVLQNNPTDICYINAEMLDNIYAMEVLVEHEKHANCIIFASARVKNNYRLALKGLYYNKGAKTDFANFGIKIRDNDVLFLIAYMNDPKYTFMFASERLKKKYFFLE